MTKIYLYDIKDKNITEFKSFYEFSIYYNSDHISSKDSFIFETKQEAEAYFAGRKQMTLTQFHNLFHVQEIKNNSKNLLLG